MEYGVWGKEYEVGSVTASSPALNVADEQPLTSYFLLPTSYSLLPNVCQWRV